MCRGPIGTVNIIGKTDRTAILRIFPNLFNLFKFIRRLIFVAVIEERTSLATAWTWKCFFRIPAFYISPLWARWQNCKELLSASSCLSVGMERLCSHWMNFSIFLKAVEWIQFSLRLVKIKTGTLHEATYTFLIISRSVLLIMRNVSDNNWRGNQNTHFVVSNLFPKIVPFMK
jgi:hypothetical protein